MLHEAPPVAFLATRNAVKARRFYSEVLGLLLVADEESALVFVMAGGQMLRVQKVLSFAPAGHTVLGWQVDDIAARMHELNQAGVHFEKYAGMQQDREGVWPSPDGTLVAWFKDPDGNLLSLSQTGGGFSQVS